MLIFKYFTIELYNYGNVVGKAKMYGLNSENPVIKKFRDFYWETTKQSVHDHIKEKKMIAV